MAATMQIDRVSGIHLFSIERGVPRSLSDIEIPGGRGLVYARGVTAQTFVLECEIIESTRLAGEQNMTQLAEIIANPDFAFHYIGFPDTETINDGFFVIENMRLPRTPDLLGVYPFQLSVRRIGGLSDFRLAQWWSSAAETVTGAGWNGKTGKRMVSLPYNCSDVDWEVLETRVGSDGGSNQIILDPTRQIITFRPAATIADWFKAECKVFDTVTPGNETEASWIQVFDSSHTFSGDCIIQNGLLRYVIGASATTFYIYDTVSVTRRWINAGEFKVLSASGETRVTHFELTRISPDEIAWREIRQSNFLVIAHLNCVLRRGARHCKTVLRTFSVGIHGENGVSLNGPSYFMQLFNNSASGSGNGSALPTDPNDIYHCGYNTSRNVVAGFVLCDKPASQPYAGGNNRLLQSNEWGASTTRTFFIVGWPQLTNPFDLTEGRLIARAIANQCLYAVSQLAVLVPRAYYV